MAKPDKYSTFKKFAFEELESSCLFQKIFLALGGGEGLKMATGRNGCCSVECIGDSSIRPPFSASFRPPSLHTTARLSTDRPTGEIGWKRKKERGGGSKSDYYSRCECVRGREAEEQRWRLMGSRQTPRGEVTKTKAGNVPESTIESTYRYRNS